MMVRRASLPGPVHESPRCLIDKLTPSVKPACPAKIKQGKRPSAYVNVTSGQTLVAGVVTFVIGKARPQQAVLRSGLATLKLPS